MSTATGPTDLAKKPFWRPGSVSRHALLAIGLFLAACGTGGDSEQAPNTPLSIPMALVVNQDDTTMTTLRLDGQGSPVISTLSLGPAQADAIGGVTFSLGEWIFVTNAATNKVAAIDPIAGLAPILEDFLDVNPQTSLVRLGQRPTRIYRYPGDKEVLLTMNEGDPLTGHDTIRGCPNGGSVTVLHNSHLSAGGEKPRVTTTVCLSGTGEHLAAFSTGPTAAAPNRTELAFVSSKTTGMISLLLADPSYDAVRWSEFIAKIDLCDSAKEQALLFPACDGSVATPNHAAPAGLFWSQATEKIYVYLSGYGSVVEIDPDAFSITRTVTITPPPPSQTVFHSVGITPNGRTLLLVGEDTATDPTKVVGRLGSVDLTAPALTATELSFPLLSNIRPARFQFTPDGTKFYMTQSNDAGGLTPAQAQNLRKDLLLVFDPSTIALVSEVTLPAAATHDMDLWITGPAGAGSAKGIVITNATPGAAGTLSLVDAASLAIAAPISVGRNPKQVTVYYVGLAASDNQATPRW